MRFVFEINIIFGPRGMRDDGAKSVFPILGGRGPSKISTSEGSRVGLLMKNR